MRVFVAGAAGAIGQQLLPQLVAQGHQVTASTRSPAKAARLRELGAEPAAAPLQGIVLRYGSFYGPGASDAFVGLVRKRRLPVIGGGAGVWSFLHIRDAAAATVAALEHGRPGVYNVVDDEPARVTEWLPFLAQAVGAKPPRRIPVWLGRLAAGEVAVAAMTQIRGSSNARAKRELGWQPAWPSWREGFVRGLSH